MWEFRGSAGPMAIVHTADPVGRTFATTRDLPVIQSTAGAMLEQALAMADLIRIEVHGPAAELAKLKEPLAHLKPAWFELHS